MSASRSILGRLARTLVAPRLQTRSLATSPHLSYGFQDPQIPGWTSAHGSEQSSHQHPTTLANGLVPIVIEQTGRGERSYDIYSRSALHIHYPTQKILNLIFQVVKRPDHLSYGTSRRLCVEHNCCPVVILAVRVCKEAYSHVGT